MGRSTESLGRVLVADDEEVFLSSIAELLARDGYQCEVARDAAEALRVLDDCPIGVLVADINMPGNDDLEFLRTVQGSFPWLPIIVVTAFPSFPTAVQSVRLAVVDYVTKPFDYAEFRTIVDRALARGTTARAARHLYDELGAFVAPQPFAGVSAGRQMPTSPDGGGAQFWPPAGAFSEPIELDRLSCREREVLDAMSRGRRVAAIAGVLHISAHTVRNHLKSIFKKLGVHSQVELLGRLR